MNFYFSLSKPLNKINDLIKRAIFFVGLMAICLLPTAIFCEDNADTNTNNISSKSALIFIEGEINPSLYKYLKRAVSDALTAEPKPKRVIFEINTFGGRLDTAYKIVELISAIEIPTVAIVKEKAISAGALISLSCADLYMLPNTTIGDCAPITMGSDGVKMMGEKFQSPLRAKFRSLALKNNYPVKLSEAMVSIDKEILQIVWRNGKRVYLDSVEYNDLTAAEKKNIVRKKTIVPKGELLTMSDVEALQLQFSRASITSIKDVLLPGEEAIAYHRSTAENIFMATSPYAWVLIMLGLVAIYLEVKTPGVGFYAISAAISFLLFFAVQNFVELANYWELLALLAGITLIIIEIYVLPGVGVVALSGVALILIASILMLQDFTLPSTPWQANFLKNNVVVVLSLFWGSLLIFIFFVWLLTRWKNSPLFLAGTEHKENANPLNFKKRLQNRKVEVEQKIFEQKSFEQKSFEQNPSLSQDNIDSTVDSEIAFISKKKLLGQAGVAKTGLRTSGLVEIDGNVYDAISKFNFITAGSKIKVVGLSGPQVVVEAIDTHAKATPTKTTTTKKKLVPTKKVASTKKKSNQKSKQSKKK